MKDKQIQAEYWIQNVYMINREREANILWREKNIFDLVFMFIHNGKIIY